MNPFFLAAVSAVLFVATGASLVLQLASAGAAQASALVMQGGMALLWGAMTLRFWTRGRVARRMGLKRSS